MAEETATTETEETTTETETEIQRTLTQEQVDRIVKDRLARQRAQFADYDELKAKAGRLDEIEAASQSELERERSAREAAQREVTDAKELIKDAKLLALIAADRRVVDPEVALGLLKKDVDFDDSGAPIGADTAIEALLEAKPYLAGEVRAPGSADLGARGEQGAQITRDDLKNMSSAEIKKAHDEGKLDHLTRGDS